MVNRMNRGNLFGASCPAMNNNNSGNSASGNMLLKQLQKIDFALVDVVLYLDAYPNCKKALDYYHKLLSERDKILVKLGDAGIPMNAFDNTSDVWNWTDSPWPWEYEAN